MKKFNFDIEIEDQPKEIIERVFVNTISESSRQLLKASVNSYSGPIRSYETTESSISVIANFTKEKTVYHDIQKELGELNRKYFTYELSIESVVLKSFKYRVLFLRYGEARYPATVVVADAISRQLDLNNTGDKPYVYIINKHEELEVLANAILNTKAFETMMQEAITASILARRQAEIDGAQ